MYAERLIQQLRGPNNTMSVQWREEYAELNTRRLVLGSSWDAYPQPDRIHNTPGITAWISNEGRGEIIVRFPPSALS
jgi:hypothetical protein